MFDFENLKLLHSHGDELVPMVEKTGDHHDAASHDAERDISWYRRVFRCTTCDEDVVLESRRPEKAAGA